MYPSRAHSPSPGPKGSVGRAAPRGIESASSKSKGVLSVAKAGEARGNVNRVVPSPDGLATTGDGPNGDVPNGGRPRRVKLNT